MTKDLAFKKNVCIRIIDKNCGWGWGCGGGGSGWFMGCQVLIPTDKHLVVCVTQT